MYGYPSWLIMYWVKACTTGVTTGSVTSSKMDAPSIFHCGSVRAFQIE